MANKKQTSEVTEEVVKEEIKEEPKEFQNEGKTLFSAKKEGGTRAY